MFPICKREFLPTPHTHIAVRPLGWRRRVKHTAGHLLPRRERVALVLQGAVRLSDVCQRVSALHPARPGLNHLQDLAPHIRIHRLRCGIVPVPQQAHEVVHELPAGDLEHEVAAPILHARVGQVESSQLDVGVLVAYPAFQAAHRFFWLDGLAADDVGDFEVEGDIFEGGGGGSLDLSIELAVGRAEPRRHGGGVGWGSSWRMRWVLVIVPKSCSRMLLSKCGVSHFHQSMDVCWKLLQQ